MYNLCYNKDRKRNEINKQKFLERKQGAKDMTNLYFYDTLCHKAKKIALKYHKGQLDKAGKDYMEHLIKVSSTFMTQDEHIVALLHDILEDTSCTVDNLHQYGIPARLIEAVVAMTRREGEAYFDYIQRLMQDPIAVKVKIADLRHNLDASRFPVPSSYPPSLKKRYEKALGMLLEQT